MTLRWTDHARRDLLAIGRYIARDNPIAARQWVERLRARQAANMPLAGRVVPELQRDNVREVLLGTYRIVYLSNASGKMLLMSSRFSRGIATSKRRICLRSRSDAIVLVTSEGNRSSVESRSLMARSSVAA
jgi:toxin ParE1/3/4